jgi:hypothetical protein
MVEAPGPTPWLPLSFPKSRQQRPHRFDEFPVIIRTSNSIKQVRSRSLTHVSLNLR